MDPLFGKRRIQGNINSINMISMVVFAIAIQLYAIYLSLKFLVNFIILNVRGLQPRTVPSKVPFLRSLLQEGNMMFAALTETWLRDHTDRDLRIDNYTLFRQDRCRIRKKPGRDSGGVACYIQNNLANSTKCIINYANGGVEILGLHVEAKNLVIVVLYRKPESGEFNKALKKLHAALEDLPASDPDIILCGDFNLPNAIWPDGGIRNGATTCEKGMISKLTDLASDFSMVQTIKEPTHEKGRTLDLLFCNNPEDLLGHYCEPADDKWKLDHYIINGSMFLRYLM